MPGAAAFNPKALNEKSAVKRNDNKGQRAIFLLIVISLSLIPTCFLDKSL